VTSGLEKDLVCFYSTAGPIRGKCWEEYQHEGQVEETEWATFNLLCTLFLTFFAKNTLVAVVLILMCSFVLFFNTVHTVKACAL